MSIYYTLLLVADHELTGGCVSVMANHSGHIAASRQVSAVGFGLSVTHPHVGHGYLLASRRLDGQLYAFCRITSHNQVLGGIAQADALGPVAFCRYMGRLTLVYDAEIAGMQVCLADGGYVHQIDISRSVWIAAHGLVAQVGAIGYCALP